MTSKLHIGHPHGARPARLFVDRPTPNWLHVSGETISPLGRVVRLFDLEAGTPTAVELVEQAETGRYVFTGWDRRAPLTAAPRACGHHGVVS